MSSSHITPVNLHDVSPLTASLLTREEREFIEKRAKTYTDIIERFQWLDDAAEMIECAKRSRDEAFRRS